MANDKDKDQPILEANLSDRNWERNAGSEPDSAGSPAVRRGHELGARPDQPRSRVEADADGNVTRAPSAVVQTAAGPRHDVMQAGFVTRPAIPTPDDPRMELHQARQAGRARALNEQARTAERGQVDERLKAAEEEGYEETKRALAAQSGQVPQNAEPTRVTTSDGSRELTAVEMKERIKKAPNVGAVDSILRAEQAREDGPRKTVLEAADARRTELLKEEQKASESNPDEPARIEDQGENLVDPPKSDESSKGDQGKS